MRISFNEECIGENDEVARCICGAVLLLLECSVIGEQDLYK